ncbi:MAG TPA: winged helix-turn-helix domain-containing protein, partial [Shewanella frigidimarina]|nr:winged helix-turn-helix domain-containing protein [Shewanella frigidimarina]
MQDLLQYCETERQVEVLKAVIEHGSNTQASFKLGIARQTVDNTVNRVKRIAATKGWSPEHDMTRPVPDAFVVRGVSTYYNKDGKPSGQWVKSKLDDDKFQELLKSAVEGFKDDLPRVSLINPPPLGNDNLLNCYVITDYHLGMLSWSEETGEDWDIQIAEDLIYKWFAQAIHQSPDANTAIFAQLSDFLHFDGMDAVTPASKHLLDVDTRFAKLVRVAIRIIRQIIDMLLQKHQHVHILMLDANHDPVSQIWLREWLAVTYENEPRITVDTSPNPYNAYEFGETALFFHHGHKKKITDVSSVFA